jgi:hypothetical protein
MSTTAALLERESSGSSLEGIGDRGISHADNVAPFYLQKLAETSSTSDNRSVGIVRSRTQAMEFVFS